MKDGKMKSLQRQNTRLEVGQGSTWSLRHYIQGEEIHPDKRKELSLGGIDKAMQSIQISAAARENEDMARGVIAIALSEAFEFFGMENSRMLRIMVDLITREYWSWKLDDVILMVQMGISGYFGKQYGKFNGAVRQEWLRSYDLMRSSRCTEIAQRYSQGIADDTDRIGERHTGPKEVKQWTEEQLERIEQIDKDK